MMLREAIKARLPIIAVTTSDPLNVGKVLEHYSPQPLLADPKVMTTRVPTLPPKSVTYIVHTPAVAAIDLVRTYEHAAAQEAVLILVNWNEPHPAMFDAGELVMPESMFTDFVAEYAPEDADRYSLVAALRGCTFKEMVELANLAMAESGEFTAESVLRVRRERTVLSSGLQLVDTDQYFYDPPLELLNWLGVDGRLFTANVARVVRPRGLLFYGPPGTGKTAGAKFLAHSLRVPLYLLDVGGTMQKYVGESEKTFSSALRQLEALGPCVLLLDEVEKVFANQDDSGVSRRVLGMLLWWLQEHPAQILTIMTTNVYGEIPPELIRPGRIDRAVEFMGLARLRALQFASHLRASLTNVCFVEQTTIEKAVNDLFYKQSNPRIAQAEITQTVVECVKQQLVMNLKE